MKNVGPERGLRKKHLENNFLKNLDTFLYFNCDIFPLEHRDLIKRVFSVIAYAICTDYAGDPAEPGGCGAG
jgi:hypothetical protein